MADFAAPDLILIRSMQRIGLFGGSFDPVHLGHLLVAQAAREELALSRLFFIRRRSPPSSPTASRHRRKRGCGCCAWRWPARSGASLDDQEIKRGGFSYTIATVRDYARRFPGAQLFYLIGADHLGQLPRVARGAGTGQRVEFIVTPRPGQAETPLPHHLGPAAFGLPVGGFLVGDSGADQGRPVHRTSGALGRGGGDPQ